VTHVGSEKKIKKKKAKTVCLLKKKKSTQKEKKRDFFKEFVDWKLPSLMHAYPYLFKDIQTKKRKKNDEREET